MINQSSHNVGFNAGVRAFTYNVAAEHLDYDFPFLGEDLSAQVVEWCDQWHSSLPPFEEPPASPPDELLMTPSGELPAIPPPSEVHREQSSRMTSWSK